jgi:hypothetical protein
MTVHVDGGFVLASIESNGSYCGEHKLCGYLFGGLDLDWKYFGFGVNLPVLYPSIRLGDRRILYADLGLVHKFPVCSSGLIALGLGADLERMISAYGLVRVWEWHS